MTTGLLQHLPEPEEPDTYRDYINGFEVCRTTIQMCNNQLDAIKKETESE